jgi:EAL domain-containing protein (putative c-di-GMP-specific phosphodiesterase class I)/GGDEF domain-containing protein
MLIVVAGFRHLREAEGSGALDGKRFPGLRAAAARIRGWLDSAEDVLIDVDLPEPPARSAAPRAAPRPGARCFLAIAEIDRFAGLKRTIGYSLANTLLQELCERVRICLPDAEVGRAGRSSIEFVFQARSINEARIRLMAASAALSRAVEVEGSELNLSFTIGVADSGGGPITDELVALAEAALADAQEQHLKIAFADASTTKATLSRLALMRDLAHAIASNALQVHYQPKLVARTGVIDGAEALVRWNHPEHGPISPDLFVRIAEETGYIRSLTEWVMKRVIADARTLQARGHVLSMHVNVSALLLPDPDFAAWALACVPAAELKIGFEITETAVLGDPRRALANLSMFADAGIRLAIDDYGSGFSSLAYLQQLPVHEIKLDKMFVSGLTSHHRDPLLVRSSIDLAHALEMEVTAEGIETPEALALLQVMGCDRIQGYLIARPMPFDALLEFLDRGDEGRDLKPVIPLAEQLQRRIAARRG